VWIDQSGISPAYDTIYLANTYIKPWQHFTEFIVFGVTFGLFFNEYIEKRKRIDLGDRHENSLSYTILKYIKKKLVLRIILNIIGFSAIIGMNVLAWFYHYSSWQVAWSITFAIVRPIIGIFGVMIILLLLLLSKNKILRFLLKLKGFHTIS
jgi:hypothetical protein